MSIAHPHTTVEPHIRRWTREEYRRLGEMGWFGDERVQLLEGEVIVMSPQSWRHASSMARVAELLLARLGDRCWVRTQFPLRLGSLSEPEPDISVVSGSREDYEDHPTSALLVVEISDTSLAIDRNRKTRIYASAGITEYWIVDLVHDTLEAHREPEAVAEGSREFAYAERRVLNRGDTIAPLAAPRVTIAVSDLLP